MPTPISSVLKAWKAAEGQPDPLVTLYDVSITDSLTLRLVAGNPTGTGSLSYNGNTYLAAAVAREEAQQNIEGELPSSRVAISNIDGIAGGYIEQYDLDDREVTITRVPISSLSPADAVTEVFTIQNPSYDRKKAVFTLGQPNFFKRKLPWRQYLRQKCAWPYEQRFVDTGGCRYPSDFFAPDSRQSFKAGASTNDEQKRRFGWYTLNAQKPDVWDVDTTVPDGCYFEIQGTGIDWRPGVLDAPFMYKKLSGDFDVSTEAALFDARDGCQVGILCQEDAQGFDSWAFFGRTQKATQEIALRVNSAQNGVGDAPTIDDNSIDAFLRMERVGNVFTLYRSASGLSWTQVNQRTVVMDTAIRIGLCVAAGDSEHGILAATFSHFQFKAGGLPACLRTKEDCSLHGNTHRFFAAPGIPRR